MSPEAWTALSAIVSAVTASVTGVLVAMVNRTNRKVDEATQVATEARDNAAPVSNGFAQHTTDQLAGVTQRLDWVVEALARHLDDHSRGNGALATKPIDVGTVYDWRDAPGSGDAV